MMILLTVIFSTMFSRNIENYPVYLLAGRGLYTFFKSGTSFSMNAIKANNNILQKVGTSKSIFVIGSVLTEFINYLITIPILIGVMIVTGCPITLNILLIIIPISILFLIILGSGLILSILGTYFSDIKHLYGIFTMALMYASALFYPMESVPLKIRQYLELNPIYQNIFQMREILLHGVMPPMNSIIYTLIIAGVLLIVGIIIFNKYQDKVIYRL